MKSDDTPIIYIIKGVLNPSNLRDLPMRLSSIDKLIQVPKSSEIRIIEGVDLPPGAEVVKAITLTNEELFFKDANTIDQDEML